MARGEPRKGRRQAVSIAACLIAALATVSLALVLAILVDCLRWRSGPTVDLRVRSSVQHECHYAFAAELESGEAQEGPQPEVRLLNAPPDDVVVRPGNATLRVGVSVPPGAEAGAYAGKLVLRRKGTIGPKTLSIPFSFHVRSWLDVWWPAISLAVVLDAAGIGLPWAFCLLLYSHARCWVKYVSLVPGMERNDADVRRRHRWLWWIFQCSKHHIRFSDEGGLFVDFGFDDIIDDTCLPPRPAASPPLGAQRARAPSQAGGGDLDDLIAGATAQPPPQASPQTPAAPQPEPADETPQETGCREFLVVFRNHFFESFALRNTGERTFEVERKGTDLVDTLPPGERGTYYPADEPTICYKGAAYKLRIIV